MNKKKLLEQYPLEILIKIINDMSDYIMDEAIEDDIIIPDVILQALTIGCAVINESELDFKDIEGLNINNYMIGLS